MVALKKTLRPVIMAPVTQPGKLPPMVGIQAVILRNAGTATVLLGGSYTLDSKETLSLNVTEEFATLDVTEIDIAFNTATGILQRLEIIVLRAANC